MFEKILVPLDGPEAAEKAIPYAEEPSRKLGSSVVLLHVTGPDHPQYEPMHRLYLESVAKKFP